MLLFLVGGLVAGGNEERVKHSANYYGLNDTGVCVCAYVTTHAGRKHSSG